MGYQGFSELIVQDLSNFKKDKNNNVTIKRIIAVLRRINHKYHDLYKVIAITLQGF